ncbi:5-formyltetrahydrofolate cyclo-ligase [Sphingomonas sp. ASV193]|uniref:5-formyltetrahydrofolate cyclo-ligase n=1 Tax=Sphingomonas sp. ASV193 TaxID=3144405 RepID=UPI0032E90F40
MAVPSPSPTDPAPDMAKARLRRTLREVRKAHVAALSLTDRAAEESALARHLEPLIARASVIGAYCPVGSEIDPRLALGGRSVVHPSFGEGGDTFRFRAGPCTATGPAGIPEPEPDALELDPDLVLVPLLAIDPVGHRLGQGGGHYDRVLGRYRASGALLVGVGWACQRLDFPLPAEQWDVALDAFASPAGLERFE